jgi:CcmD family protein
MENLNWLFYAYGIGWGLILIYLYNISRKESSLRRKISDLQETIEARWKK